MTKPFYSFTSKWDDDANFLEMVPLIFLLIWMTIFVLLLCETGTRMTQQFNALSDELSRCDWYLMTIGMQQMYLIFLSDTQNAIKMLSFANIPCERETSKKVFSNVKTIHFNSLVINFHLFQLSDI